MYEKLFLAGASKRKISSLQFFCALTRAAAPFCDSFVNVIFLFIIALVFDVSSNPSSDFTSTTPALHDPEITCAKHSVAKIGFFGEKNLCDPTVKK